MHQKQNDHVPKVKKVYNKKYNGLKSAGKETEEYKHK
jgi:hypothetical protein